MRICLLLILVPTFLLLSLTRAESPGAPDNKLEQQVSTSAPDNETRFQPIDVEWTPNEQWAWLSVETQCPIHTVPPTSSSSSSPAPGDPSSTPSNNEVVLDIPVDAEIPSPADQESTEVENDGFVSFEEWKQLKLLEEDAKEHAEDMTPESSVANSSLASPDTEITVEVPPTDVNIQGSPPSTAPENTPQAPAISLDANQSSSSATLSTALQPAATQHAHHHSKYNFASPDCSARIHSSSPQTQHASSLLHKSRDRYMLTPCKAKEHWVIVELCDEIRIEAVEVAVWEFFSGVVREVRVSVGGEDEEDDEEIQEDAVRGRGHKWEEVGYYVGKNIRGAQTFTLSRPTSFHRFIRLDFPSYFGSEYYCPVSSLKVYGMNQMEAFKWEQKQIHAAAKEKDRNGNKEKEREMEERRAKERLEKEKREVEERQKQQQREWELDELEKLLHEQAGRIIPDIATESGILSEVEDSTAVPVSSIPESTASARSAVVEEPETIPDVTSINEASLQPNISSKSPISESVVSSSHSVYTSTSTQLSAQPSKSTGTSTASPETTTTYSRVPPPRSDSSESIYAFIIRRLNALEANSALVARYVEEQARVMRSMLKRVETEWDEWKVDWEDEDRGRWQQERMRQEDRLGRVMSQLEQQRTAFENERKAIQAQLRVLGDELRYERRRGIAQLIIMVIIVVLGVATRSSTIDAVLTPLLSEARRRRSVYNRESASGPLTGLRIDMGDGRPAKVIGQERSGARAETGSDRPPTSPAPTPRIKTHLSRNSSGHTQRPTTPAKRRTPQGPFPPLRSFSTADYNSTPTNGGIQPIIQLNLSSPRPRVSLPSTKGTRRLAKSAHLHTIEADRVRDTVSQDVKRHAKPPLSDPNSVLPANPDTPKRHRSKMSISTAIGDSASEATSGTDDDERESSVGKADDGVGEWNTDFETEASASEVEYTVENICSDDRANDIMSGMTDAWGTGDGEKSASQGTPIIGKHSW